MARTGRGGMVLVRIWRGETPGLGLQLKWHILFADGTASDDARSGPFISRRTPEMPPQRGSSSRPMHSVRPMRSVRGPMMSARTTPYKAMLMVRHETV